MIDMVCLVIVDHLLMPQPGPSGPEVEHSFSSHKDPLLYSDNVNTAAPR